MKSNAARIALCAAALGVLLAAPAEAAKAGKHKSTSAAKPAAGKQHARPPAVRAAGPNDVYFQGQYIGSDPDPRVRFELYRDLGRFFGGDD
jgi:hypothetical protein